VGDTKVDMTFPDSNKYTAKVLASDIFFTGDTGYTLPINTNPMVDAVLRCYCVWFDPTTSERSSHRPLDGSKQKTGPFFGSFWIDFPVNGFG